MRNRAARRTRQVIQGTLIAPPNSVVIPAATIVTMQIADVGSLRRGGVTMVDNNMFRADPFFQLSHQGDATASVDIEGTLDPANANNMQMLVELGADNMDVAGNGTVFDTLISEAQIVGGNNSNLVKFLVGSRFNFLTAPNAWQLRVRGVVSGAGVTFNPTLLRSEMEAR